MRRIILSICLCWILPATAMAGDDSVNVRLLTSNLRPFVGESLVITMEIIRPERLSQPLSPIWPKMNGLVFEESLPSVARRLSVAGETRIVESLRRVVRPLRPGKLSLQEAAVSIGGTHSRAPELRLMVAPLPTHDVPDTFSGAVGAIDVHLESAGSGRRQVSLRLNGRADLNNLPSPLTTGHGDRLILLEDENQGQWPERKRLLRYLFLPADNGSGELAVKLSWFDPQTKSYLRYDDTKRSSAFGFLLRAILLLLSLTCSLWLFWRYYRFHIFKQQLLRMHRTCPQTAFQIIFAVPEHLKSCCRNCKNTGISKGAGFLLRPSDPSLRRRCFPENLSGSCQP